MRNTGKVWVVLVAVLGGVLLAGFIGFRWYMGSYNRSVAYDEFAKKSWSDVDAQLQRRLDLIPNLVQTVKGYAEHEKELFENIAQSREKYFQGNQAEKMEASNQLSGFLSRLMVLQEAYPDLKANQNFRDLQSQLEGPENRISGARMRYNDAVGGLNTYRRTFFGSYFCERAQVEARDYFEASVQARTEVPAVQF